ncbi:MAG: hypothetical protein GY787_06370 [Alteromonadales bacterium]|nr:hypothetical protein [Alteromonadales bacterium]
MSANHQTACISHDEPNTIIDKTYHYINDSFCQPAVWFDDFFVDERATEDAYAGTMIRWYNDFSWNESENVHYKTKLSARIHLPKVTQKLKLIFEPESEDSILNLFPNETTEPENSLGLQYDWITKERQSLSVKVTIRPRIELRYRYLYPLYESLLVRFTQKIYQRKKISGGAVLLDFDHSINSHFLLRWANFVTRETEDLLELGSGLILYQYISATQALNYKASLTAQEKPEHYISNYHLSVTYRHNILRKWFYYEIIPELNWPKELDSIRDRESKITLRLEVLFDSI